MCWGLCFLRCAGCINVGLVQPGCCQPAGLVPHPHPHLHTNMSPRPWSNRISAGTRESAQPSTAAKGVCFCAIWCTRSEPWCGWSVMPVVRVACGGGVRACSAVALDGQHAWWQRAWLSWHGGGITCMLYNAVRASCCWADIHFLQLAPASQTARMRRWHQPSRKGHLAVQEPRKKEKCCRRSRTIHEACIALHKSLECRLRRVHQWLLAMLHPLLCNLDVPCRQRRGSPSL